MTNELRRGAALRVNYGSRMAFWLCGLPARCRGEGSSTAGRHANDPGIWRGMPPPSPATALRFPPRGHREPSPDLRDFASRHGAEPVLLLRTYLAVGGRRRRALCSRKPRAPVTTFNKPAKC